MITADAVPAAGLRVELLGPVRAWRDDHELALGPPRRRAVLAVLALRPGEAVSRDEIIDAVWGDAPPASAANNVHIYIGALRRVLEPRRDRGGYQLLLSSRSGYLLRLAPGQVDLHVFDEHLRSAGRLGGDGELAGAVDAIDAALRLWRGTPLAGVDGPAADAQRLRLADLRLTALEDRAEAMLGLGRGADLAAELSALAGEHPLRERLRGLLMLALYRSGRQAEALRVYADTRRLLVAELGIEPGPALRRLHRAVLTNRDVDIPQPTGRRRPAVESAGPAESTDAVVPRQLPPAVAHFTGRTAELAVLDGLLDRAGAGGTVVISAINGTAGIGKTALAVRWAHRAAERFTDGQLYVNLRGFDPSSPMTAGAAVRAFLDALGVPAARIPVGQQAQVGLYRSLLAGKRMLVVLDNARDAEQVRPLLPGAPGCLVLVTSRNQLSGLVAAEGAHPITLDLLTAAEARQLLARHLGAGRVAAEPPAADEIIAACAGLPLALSIVAARAVSRPGFPLAELAGEVRQAAGARDGFDGGDRAGGLDGFDGGDQGTDLRAVFSWSYRSLGPAAARVFRLLGLHAGPDIGVAAVASLAGMPVGQVRPPLAELARAHLVTEHRPGRYACHDLLRAYATELALTTPTDRREALHRVLDHYLHTAYAAARLIKPYRDPIDPSPPRPGVTPEEITAEAPAATWFGAEHQVLLAAVHQAARYGFDTHVCQLAWSLTTFLDRRGHWHNMAATQAAALDAARRLADRHGQAEAHHGLASAHVKLGRYDDARTHLHHALDLYRDLGDHGGQARTHHVLAWMLARQGRHREAPDHARRALDLYRRTSHHHGQAAILNLIGWSHANLGDYRQALAYCRRALDLHRRIGDHGGQAGTWDSIGYAHHHLGHHRQATICYRRALALYRETGDRWGEADVLTHLGDTHHAAGRPDAAGTAWRDAVAILDELDHADAAHVRARLHRLAHPEPAHPTQP